MRDFITHDRSLRIGDIVLSNYHKSNFLFRITEIERRFLTAFDLRYDTYKDANIGDEYNSLATIESVAAYNIIPSAKKPRKVSKHLDMSWLVKVSPQDVEAYVKRLNTLITELWP
jgi:hypothetical protein